MEIFSSLTITICLFKKTTTKLNVATYQRGCQRNYQRKLGSCSIVSRISEQCAQSAVTTTNSWSSLAYCAYYHGQILLEPVAIQLQLRL